MGREAQEAGRAAELVAQSGQHLLRPARDQAQRQEAVVAGAQPEGFRGQGGPRIGGHGLGRLPGLGAKPLT
jgi:hypothetical protein